MRPFEGGFAIGATAVRAHLLAHDHLGTVGFLLEHEGMRLGFATDLGLVPPSLVAHFGALHALALESNYDRSMQVSSGRPKFLKRRIMGGMGHLSNEQALDAVVRIDTRSPLSQVALLHMSRQCNRVELIRDLYRRRAPQVLPRLTVTRHDRPTAMLEVKMDVRPAGRQMALWGG